jgi:hypothetical protein
MLWSLGELDAPLDRTPALLRSAALALSLQLQRVDREQLARLLWGLSRAGVGWDALSPHCQTNISLAMQRLAPSMTAQDLVP